MRSALICIVLVGLQALKSWGDERAQPAAADRPPVVEVEGQPLGANVTRLVRALEMQGTPLPMVTVAALSEAARSRDAIQMQQVMDDHVLLVVQINPEGRVKTERGPAKVMLQQGGFRPVILKVLNQAAMTAPLKLISPQSGPVYAGPSKFSLQRQQQPALEGDLSVDRTDERFLAVELFGQPPLSPRLSGLEVEYCVGMIFSSESGKREATIGVEVGQRNKDLGFRGATPVLFEIKPAMAVRMEVRDEDDTPSMAHFVFRERLESGGHIYPLQVKRIAPDLFFQPQIYRQHGEIVWLPPGEFDVEYGRGPEYKVKSCKVQVNAESKENLLSVRLERWIDLESHGFFSGDHHIHAAGCSHYTVPTEGVSPEDMFRQVKGEGLNVGCVLTWGPCYAFQRRFFSERPHGLSEPRTILKYDVEVSGFGSQALGHVCLLNLRDQTYPGSEETSIKGWPTWTTPVLRWAKQQGAVTGYAHSASGMNIDASAAAKRLLSQFDADRDEALSDDETREGLLPEPFASIDRDGDQLLSSAELAASHDRAADQLPNYAIPELNGVGAMEIFVSTAEGVCDFISAMDTSRIQEWNTWYHLLNCGFMTKVSGETDFPCMSSRRVGQGRVYVRLGQTARLDFSEWCTGLAQGKSYVSDGYAHAVDFQVAGVRPGEGQVVLEKAGTARVFAKIAFAPAMPRSVAQGTKVPTGGRRFIGDTVELHGEREEVLVETEPQLVELVVNGQVVRSWKVPADGKIHEVESEVVVKRSSWVAIRQFPQFHTNPVNVLVNGKPIRASRKSAQWCLQSIEQLWKNRKELIAADERLEAEGAFERAKKEFRRRRDEAFDEESRE